MKIAKKKLRIQSPPVHPIIKKCNYNAIYGRNLLWELGIQQRFAKLFHRKSRYQLSHETNRLFNESLFHNPGEKKRKQQN